MTDNEYPLDLPEIIHLIRSADVMLIRFTTFDKRLLFDARSDQEEGPIVRVVPRAGSAAERFKHLKGLRPRFPLPKNIVSFTWPKHVSSLERLGIWQVIVDRIHSTGYYDSGEECRLALTELRAEERDQIHNAITGEGFETLWETQAQQRVSIKKVWGTPPNPRQRGCTPLDAPLAGAAHQLWGGPSP